MPWHSENWIILGPCTSIVWRRLVGAAQNRVRLELRPKIGHTENDLSFCSSFIESTANRINFLVIAFFLHKNRCTDRNSAFKIAVFLDPFLQ